MQPLLIKFDKGLLARVDREKSFMGRTQSGKMVPRTQAIRELVREALDKRAETRGEAIPTATPIGMADDYRAAESKPETLDGVLE